MLAAATRPISSVSAIPLPCCRAFVSAEIRWIERSFSNSSRRNSSFSRTPAHRLNFAILSSNTPIEFAVIIALLPSMENPKASIIADQPLVMTRSSPSW